MFKKENIPNILTLLRILIIPIIIIFLEIDTKFYSWLALVLYIIACLSDFLDGYLARKFELESSFGRFLDPVADKILVVFILIGLSVNLYSYLMAAMSSLIISREIGVAALRDYAARNDMSHKSKVTFLAKFRTPLLHVHSLQHCIG